MAHETQTSDISSPNWCRSPYFSEFQPSPRYSEFSPSLRLKWAAMGRNPAVTPNTTPGTPRDNTPMGPPAIIDCPRAHETAAQSPILKSAKRNEPIMLPSPEYGHSAGSPAAQSRCFEARSPLGDSFIGTPELWSQPTRQHQIPTFSMLPPTDDPFYLSDGNGYAFDDNYDYSYLQDQWSFCMVDQNDPSSENPLSLQNASSYIPSEYHDYEEDLIDPEIPENDVELTKTYKEGNLHSREGEKALRLSSTRPSLANGHYGRGASSPTRHKVERTVLAPLNSTHPPNDWNSQPTTLMFRNIPNKYTREMLLNEISEKGFYGKYDFFYLPIDFRNRCNVGYAFINFVSHIDAALFRESFQGRQLKAFNSAKICEVTVAKVQGKDANIEQYRNSAVMNMDEKYHPLVFEAEKRVRFPAPTVGLRPYRPRAQLVGADICCQEV